MNRLIYFLMVGLAFTVLQVSTVAAEDAGAPVLTIGDPACQTPPAIGCPAGSPGLMGDPNMPPTAAPMGDPNMPPTAAPMGDPNMPPTAAPMGDPNMPPTAAPMGDPNMAPPMGDSADKPSMGERVKSFFGIGEKDATPPTGAPGTPPTGAPVLTIGDPACATVPAAAGCPAGSPGLVAPPMGDPNMPPPVPADPMGTAGAPPTGDQSGIPPAGQ
jgi:hypothetical protein